MWTKELATMRILVFLCTLPAVCTALANPVQDFLSRLQGPNADSQPPPALDPQAVKKLQELNLTASTDPKLASARPQQIPNLLTATAPAIFRAASGIFAEGYKLELIPRDDTKYTYASFGDRQIQETGVYRPPNEPIIIYEFESCPFCRKVREACSMLSLPVTFRPTPKNGRKFRPEIKEKFGNKATFPYMVDRNTGVKMFESADIIEYLFKVYGNGKVPWTLSNSPWQTVSAGLGVGLARLGAGGSYRTSKPPSDPVILWAYEGSPFCKVVRETLCSLEIPHTVIFTPRGSTNRQKLWGKTGRFQVPYLEDPNTDVSMFESEAIVEYLEKLYGVARSPVEYV